MKKLIRKLITKFTLQTPSILKNVKNNFDLYDVSYEDKTSLNNKIDFKILEKLNIRQRTFGNLNEDKIFYVINLLILIIKYGFFAQFFMKFL